MKKLFLPLLPLMLLAFCTKFAAPSRPQIEFALGTICEINLYEGGTNQLYSNIFSRILEIDRTMSTFPGDFDNIAGDAILDAESKEAALIQSITETLVSGIVAINRNAGIEPVKVRPDLIFVLEKAYYYAELSGGAFDPTIGPIVNLWGIGTENQRVPNVDEIEAALELVNWQDLIIDHEAGTVFLKREGMALDVGGIAKGYAADEAARIAKEAGINRAIINLGGNIAVMGWRENRGSASLPWRIGIQDPLHERGAYIGVLSVYDTSVVTSGIYERYFIVNDYHYHHIFSTTNGRPVDNGLLSATVITKNSIDADALSTVIFTLGFEQGKQLIDSIPETEAIFVLSDNRIYFTGSLADSFRLTNEELSIFWD